MAQSKIISDCENAASLVLKAPSTAKYVDKGAYGWTPPLPVDSFPKPLGFVGDGRKYDMQVDSQNGFGAVLRTHLISYYTSAGLPIVLPADWLTSPDSQ